MAPAITVQPASKTVNIGQTAKFTVVASGTAPLHYQWTKNGADLADATNAAYTTPPATAEDNGALFSVAVSNVAGSVTGNNATLTVTGPPVITQQPADKSVKIGQKAKFTITVSGAGPFAYQWRKNGINLPGATKASYTTLPALPTDNGSLFSVVVSNGSGSVNSNDATLTLK